MPRPVAPAAREARARRRRSAREAVDGVSWKPGLRPSWRRATAPTLGPATAVSRAPPTRPVARGAAPTTRARGRLGRLPGVAPVLHTCLTAGVAPRRSASARGARRHAAHAPRRAGHCAPNRCPRVKPARPKPRAIGTTTAERLLRSMRPPRPPKLTIAHKACFLAASHAAAAASFCAAPPQRARLCPGPVVLGRAPPCARQRRREGRRTKSVRPSLRYIGILGPRSLTGRLGAVQTRANRAIKLLLASLQQPLCSQEKLHASFCCANHCQAVTSNRQNRSITPQAQAQIHQRTRNGRNLQHRHPRNRTLGPPLVRRRRRRYTGWRPGLRDRLGRRGDLQRGARGRRPSARCE